MSSWRDQQRERRQTERDAEEEVKYRKKAPSYNTKRKSIKQRMRDVRRLLKRSLPAEVRRAKLDELAEMEEQLKANANKEKEKKNVAKYRMVRFFDRKKLERKLKQAQAAVDSNPDDDTAAKHLQELKDNVEYIMHFPATKKYVSLYPSKGSTMAAEERAARVASVRATILARIQAGEISRHYVDAKGRISATRHAVGGDDYDAVMMGGNAAARTLMEDDDMFLAPIPDAATSPVPAGKDGGKKSDGKKSDGKKSGGKKSGGKKSDGKKSKNVTMAADIDDDEMPEEVSSKRSRKRKRAPAPKAAVKPKKLKISVDATPNNAIIFDDDSSED